MFNVSYTCADLWSDQLVSGNDKYKLYNHIPLLLNLHGCAVAFTILNPCRPYPAHPQFYLSRYTNNKLTQPISAGIMSDGLMASLLLTQVRL